MPEKASILIIDDDEGMLETLSDILKEKGYQTETAKTGMKAIAKAKVYPFDIALLDIRLPDMLGTEVLRTLRKEQPTMMIIMITANATLTTAVDALNLGANAYIMKPIDPEMLDKTIKRCLTQIYTSRL
jgi:DNA-binding response OmpR family regulator